eukprot:evm.model.scf_947.3 EVM.evm.TU.scf_947.3   scf_947:38898-45847(-)
MLACESLTATLCISQVRPRRRSPTLGDTGAATRHLQSVQAPEQAEAGANPRGALAHDPGQEAKAATAAVRGGGDSIWKRSLLLLLVCSAWATPSMDVQENLDGWHAAIRGRFPYIVSIRGRYREHHCIGAVIYERLVLTSSQCVGDVGPNPIIVIGSQGYLDDRWTDGVQEQRVEMAHRHPNWTKNVEEGYDVALLRLPRAVKVRTPRLAGRDFNAYANLALVAFTLGNTLKMAPFQIVRNTLCPHMAGMVDSMLCMHSAISAMHSGDSGGPVLLLDSMDPSDNNIDGKTNDPKGDLIVGVVSYANYSALNESGIGIVPVSEVREWIDSYVPEEVQPPRDNSILLTLAILAPTLIFWLILTGWGRRTTPAPTVSRHD